MPFGEPQEDQTVRRLSALVGAIADADLRNRQAQVEMLRKRREKEAAASALEPYQTAMQGPPTGGPQMNMPNRLPGVKAQQAAYPNAGEQKNLALSAILSLSKQGTAASQQAIGNLNTAKGFMPEEVKREPEVTSGNFAWNPDTQEYEQIGEKAVIPRNVQYKERLKKDSSGKTVMEDYLGKKVPVYEIFDPQNPSKVIGEKYGTAIGPPGQGNGTGKEATLRETTPYTLPSGAVQQHTYSGKPEALVNQYKRRLQEIDDLMKKRGGEAEKNAGFLGIKAFGGHAGWLDFVNQLEAVGPYGEGDVKVEDLGSPQVQNFADEYITLSRKIKDLNEEYGLIPAEEPSDGGDEETPEENAAPDEEAEPQMQEAPTHSDTSKVNKTTTGKRYTIKVK